MKLNDKLIQAAKPKDAQYNLADGNGLKLVVKPNGTKLWWLRYRFAGKAKTLSLGQYPLISLKDARERAYEARKLLANNTDPSQVKKETAAAI
jgi:hypothetical protein